MTAERSDPGLGVLVVLLRAHRPAGGALPCALGIRGLPDRLAHRADVRLEAPAARADVVDPPLPRRPRVIGPLPAAPPWLGAHPAGVSPCSQRPTGCSNDIVPSPGSPVAFARSTNRSAWPRS